MVASVNNDSGGMYRIERVGIAGKLRGFLAGILGCILWIALLVGYATARAGDEPAPVIEILFAMLITASVSAAPLILSQMTRGSWQITEEGVAEKIAPLVSFLPLGLHRERLIRWGDIVSSGIHEMRFKNNLHYYFRAEISGQPRIEIARKNSDLDPEFTEFAEEFSRRMERRS